MYELLTKSMPVIGAIAAGLLVAGASAVASESVDDAAARCRVIADGVARLSCYDRAFGVVVPAAAPTTTTADRTFIDANTEEGFGLTAAEREQRSRTPETEAPRALDEIEAKVTDFKQPRSGRFTLTLDNGQIWQQRETDASIYIRVGDVVTIKKAMLGSYLLVTEGRRSTKVERIK